MFGADCRQPVIAVMLHCHFRDDTDAESGRNVLPDHVGVHRGEYDVGFQTRFTKILVDMASYDAESGRLLILDVSRHEYPPIWVTASQLYDAMHILDSDAQNRSRGFVIVQR